MTDEVEDERLWQRAQTVACLHKILDTAREAKIRKSVQTAHRADEGGRCGETEMTWSEILSIWYLIICTECLQFVVVL